MSAMERIDWLVRVVSASSFFAGADAQIRIADCLVITWPATGVAEQRTVSCIGLYDRRGSLCKALHSGQ